MTRLILDLLEVMVEFLLMHSETFVGEQRYAESLPVFLWSQY